MAAERTPSFSSSARPHCLPLPPLSLLSHFLKANDNEPIHSFRTLSISSPGLGVGTESSVSTCGEPSGGQVSQGAPTVFLQQQGHVYPVSGLRCPLQFTFYAPTSVSAPAFQARHPSLRLSLSVPCHFTLSIAVPYHLPALPAPT